MVEVHYTIPVNMEHWRQLVFYSQLVATLGWKMIMEPPGLGIWEGVDLLRFVDFKLIFEISEKMMVCMLMSGKLRFNLSFTFELDPKCGQKWLNDAWKCVLVRGLNLNVSENSIVFSPSGQKTLHKTVSCSFIDLIGPIHFTTFVSHSMRC